MRTVKGIGFGACIVAIAILVLMVLSRHVVEPGAFSTAEPAHVSAEDAGLLGDASSNVARRTGASGESTRPVEDGHPEASDSITGAAEVGQSAGGGEPGSLVSMGSGGPVGAAPGGGPAVGMEFGSQNRVKDAKPMGTISGIVVDGEGEPVGEASLQAQGKFGGGNATSNADGAFEIGIFSASGTFPVGEENLCMVSATKPGLGSASVLRVPLGEDGVELVIWGNAIIQGMVVDASSGAPIQDFEARIVRARSPVEGMMGTGHRWTAFQDAGGWFTLESSNDIGQIAVRARGHEEQRIDMLVQTGELVDDLVVELIHGYSIAGIVVDAQTGAAIPNVAVGITNGDIGQWWSPTDANMPINATSDANGRFVIEGAASTAFVDLAAWDENYAIAYLIGFDASSGEEAVFRLTQGGRIEGTVLRNGEPFSGLRMWVGNSFGRPYEHGNEAPDAASFLALAGTDGSGHYAFQRLPAGRYQVRVMDADPNTPLPLRYLQRRWTDVEEGVTTTLDFNLETGSTVTGYVVGLADVSTVQLRLYDVQYPDQVLYSTEERHDSSKPDAEGFFRFPPVPAGEYVVRGTVPGPTPIDASAQCVIGAGETAEVVLEFAQQAPEG